MMITHVSAYNGGLRMYAGNYRNLKGWSKTAKGVAYTLKTCGIGAVSYTHLTLPTSG